jgi:GntR family carbon starvation induced transcriptional regulator
VKTFDEELIEELPNAAGTITMRLYNRLRQDIIDGVLPPGRKLKIDDIGRTYDAGSSPVREALNLLTSFGLVERLDQRGFRVRPISAAEFADLLRVRCWVEERALREAIAHGDEQWEEGIALAQFRANRAAKARAATGDVRDTVWEQHHRSFHMALLAGCGSPMLLDYCGQLFDQTIRYRQIAGSLSMPIRDTEAEHAELVDATINRQADLAVELLTRHYHSTSQYLSSRLFANPDESAPPRDVRKK